MMRTALYIGGRVVIGDSHLDAYHKLTEAERLDDEHLVSGFYDPETNEFVADMEKDHFYTKEMYLVRHATPCRSDGDPDLSDEGIEQIRAVAQEMSAYNFDGFTGISSPMLRCLRTSAILSEYLHIEFCVLPEIIEPPILSEQEDVVRVHSRADQFPDFKWPNSCEWHVSDESYHEFLDRVKNTLRHLPSKSIVVSHTGYIFSVVRAALCPQKAEMLAAEGLPPASVTYINNQNIKRLG